MSVAIALVAALAGLAGCGTKELVGDRISGTTLTIYSSVPLHGASSVSGQSIVNGARLALAKVGGRIGKYHIVLRALDDSTVGRGGWDPGQTTVDAHQAIQDRTTIGYIGELDSGASAISIPLLNRVGIPQISPASTAVGLTSADPGASPGEPLKYYPTGRRTYARVVPSDSVQAVAQVRAQRNAGCKSTYVLDDGQFDGEDAAASFQLAAQAARLPVPAVQTYDPLATDYTSLAAAVAQTGANCVLISASTEENAVLVTRQVAAALPNAKLFGSAGLAESTYTDPVQGGVPASLDPRILITIATLGPSGLAAPGRAFYQRYEARYGPPEPYAICGYEAMSLMLNAIARATDNGRKPARRSQVLNAIFHTRNRQSVLGTYSIDANGDTTLRRYGLYRVVGGQLEFWQAMDG